MKTLFFGLSGFFLLAAVVAYYAGHKPETPRQHDEPGATSKLSGSDAPLPSNVSLPSNSPHPIEKFRVLSSTPDGGEFQLDARAEWQELPLVVNDGDSVSWEADGMTCTWEPVPKPMLCFGPDGMDTPGIIPWAENSLYKPEQYPVGHSYVTSLLMRIGMNSGFQAGSQGARVIPSGTGRQPIKMMACVRIPELPLARKGFRVKLSVRHP